MRHNQDIGRAGEFLAGEASPEELELLDAYNEFLRTRMSILELDPLVGG